jgi:NNP family nitrate/nitrite transporter-like MFS transporter
MHQSAPSPEALPTRILVFNTLAFALSFAVWVIFGPSSRAIAKELHLTLGAAALLKSTPILVGSLTRIPIGILTDRLGARLVFPLLMLCGAAASVAISFGSSYAQILGGGAVLGLIGATFAVGVQSVSSWTPKAKQGTALGIFGAGNIGTAITTFGLPLVIAAWGWRGGFRLYAAGIVCMALTYLAVVRNSARKGAAPTFKTLISPLGQARTWRFGLYYMACFGVFVAAALVLSDIYIDGYHVKQTTAGYLVTTFTFSASLIRILGGKLADRHGARKVVRWSLLAAMAGLIPVTMGLPIAAMVLAVLVAGLAMGICMGASMKYVPEYFPGSVGAVGGIVGALGGVGGFLLPLAGAQAKALFGSPFAAIVPMVLVMVAAALVQHVAVTQLRAEEARKADSGNTTPAGGQIRAA